MNLWALKQFEHQLIEGFSPELNTQQKQRLIELGFHLGERVTCVQTPSYGAPRLFRLNQTIYALDQDIASLVLTKATPSE